MGLRNVERRLACQFGATASLIIRSSPGDGTMVEIRLPVLSGKHSRARVEVGA